MALRAESQRYISVCSGAGGLDLGVRGALPQAECVLYVEIEVSAAERLVANIEEGLLDPAPVWSNFLTLNGREWRGLVDGVVAGIPCQPHSYAGLQRGADDSRDLWPATAKFLRDCEPGWFLLENVPGILPYYFDRIKPDLEGLGYRVAEALVTAAEVGAFHKRERLFVLADRAGTRREGDECEGVRSFQSQRGDKSVHGRMASDVRGNVAHGDLAGLGQVDEQGAGTREAGEPVWLRYELPRFPPGPGDLESWGFILATRPDLAPALPAQSPFHGVADGLAAGDGECLCARPDELRIIGNGVVPAQAAYAIRLLIEGLNSDE